MNHKKTIIKDIIDDILVSFILLTILPLFNFRKTNVKINYTRAQWAFPLVGFFLGLITILIIKILYISGLNLLIASTFGVVINFFILGLLQENKPLIKSTKKNNHFYLGINVIDSNYALVVLFLIFLKIHLITQLLAVDNSSFIVIGCYSLGTFSIVFLRKISYSILGDNFSSIVAKSNNKNLLISTSIVIVSLSPLGFSLTTILLLVTLVIVFSIKIISKSLNNKKNNNLSGIYIQIIEISLFIILDILLIN